ncbi:Uv-b-induced protein, partial [Thalictrum thalictroides]
SSIRRIPIIEALPIVVKSQRRGASFFASNFAFSNSSRKSTLHSQNHLKVSGVPKSGRHFHARRRSLPLSVAIANADSRAKKFSGVGTPLKPSSQEGKFLSGVLQYKRHLFRFAVSEQLDELASDRNGAVVHKKLSLASLESLLHRRIAELKENECQIAVEDVMYMSIVHKFSEIDVPMIPKLSRCIIDNRIDIWPSKCRELESIHNLNVQEMIGKHFATVVSLIGNVICLRETPVGIVSGSISQRPST